MGGNRRHAKPFKVKAAKSARAYTFRDAAKTFPVTALDAQRIEKFVSSIPKTTVVSRLPSGRILSPPSQAERLAKTGKAMAIEPRQSRGRSARTPTRRKPTKRRRKTQPRKSAIAVVAVEPLLQRPQYRRKLNSLRARLKRAELLRKLQAAAKDKPAASA